MRRASANVPTTAHRQTQNVGAARNSSMSGKGGQGAGREGFLPSSRADRPTCWFP